MVNPAPPGVLQQVTASRYLSACHTACMRACFPLSATEPAIRQTSHLCMRVSRSSSNSTVSVRLAHLDSSYWGVMTMRRQIALRVPARAPGLRPISTCALLWTGPAAACPAGRTASDMRRARQTALAHLTSRAALCSFQHYTSDRLATADAHGRVMIHLLAHTGEEIVINQLLDLQLGSLHGMQPLQGDSSHNVRSGIPHGVLQFRTAAPLSIMNPGGCPFPEWAPS